MSRLSQKLIKNLLSLFVLIIISLAVYEILKLLGNERIKARINML